MIVKIKPTSYQYSLHTVNKTHEGLTTGITLIFGAELGYKEQFMKYNQKNKTK